MTFTLAQIASSFVAPALAGAGAVAVSIPVAIHILSRLRRKQEPWAAMRFVLEAYRRHRTRLRLEQWVLLAVRCLLVLVIGLALAGPVATGLAAAWTGAAGGGRTLHLVMDDALTGHLRTPADQTRLDELKTAAGSLLDALGPGDSVTLWRASRPAEAALLPATLDVAAARTALDAMTPRYSRSSIGDALDLIARQIDAEQTGGESVIALLSDWAQGAGELNEAPPATLTGLGERARVLTTRPMVAATNTQISALGVRRPVVLVEAGEQAVASVQVQVTRFGPEAGETTPALTVRARSLEGSVLAETTRRPRLAAGQIAAALNVELAIPLDGGASTGPRPIILEAQLDEPDALPADDVRLGLVELRRSLRVGLVGASVGVEPGELSPRAWLRIALSPTPDDPIAVTDLLPTAVSAAEISELDALLVLRPDLLPTTAWPQLEEFARRGGIVWLMTPAQPDAAATWVRPMLDALGLPWTIAMDLAVAGEASGAWTVATESDPPEALRSLAADWSALLRPLRVTRRLPVLAPADEAWLSLDVDDDAGDVLLAEAAVGDGHVLLLATALDVEWANLVTKPAFVPLLHETLRALAKPRAGLAVAPAGTAPDLSDAWRRTRAIQYTTPADTPAPNPVPLQTQGEQITPATPLDLPGIWTPATGSAPLRLAVNVDAPAGDTRPLTADRLEQWFAAMGPWAYLDEADPGGALAAPATRTDLTWPLLWAALALALLEAALARSFSHASVAGRQTWPARLVRTVRMLRVGGVRTGASGRPTRRDRAA